MTSKVMFVGIKGYRKCDEPECVGVWEDRAQAITDISNEHNYNSDFSDPENGFWGTEEWSIFLQEQEKRDENKATTN